MAYLEVDERHRVSLGKLAEHRRYVATRDPLGRIILEPALVLTQTQLRLLQNDELWARVASALEETAEPFELPGPEDS